MRLTFPAVTNCYSDVVYVFKVHILWCDVKEIRLITVEFSIYVLELGNDLHI